MLFLHKMISQKKEKWIESIFSSLLLFVYIVDSVYDICMYIGFSATLLTNCSFSFDNFVVFFFFLRCLLRIPIICIYEKTVPGTNGKLYEFDFVVVFLSFFFIFSIFFFWLVWSSFHWLDIVARYSIHRKFVVYFFLSSYSFYIFSLKAKQKRVCVRYSMNIWHRQSSTTTKKISFKVNQFGRRPTTNDQWSQNQRWMKRNFTPL